MCKLNECAFVNGSEKYKKYITRNDKIERVGFGGSASGVYCTRTHTTQINKL